MSQLQQQLQKALADQQSAGKVRRHLEQLDQRLQAEYGELEQLGKALEKENEDYEKLQRLSLKGLFYKVLGSKEEQMEKEKQEYLQASLKYEETSKTVDLMEYERKVLQEKLDNLEGIEQKVEQLLKQREQELIRRGGAKGQQLLQLAQRLDEQYRLEREVGEALEVAGDAIKVLAQMFGFLQKARNWGNWDMVGGRQMSTLIKHSNIDKARALAHKARMLLLKFEDELRDIYTDVGTLDLSLKMDSFVRFSDIFFDNLISDWIVQQRIRNSLAAVRSVHDRVKRMSTTLLARRRSIEAAINQMEVEREQILAAQ